MKLICSMVHHHKLDTVKQALAQIRVLNLNVSEVLDYTPQRYETTVWLGHEYSLGFSRKVEINVTVDDDQVEEVVATIIQAAQTGRRGDGHVLVLPLEHHYSIRGGDHQA